MAPITGDVPRAGFSREQIAGRQVGLHFVDDRPREGIRAGFAKNNVAKRDMPKPDIDAADSHRGPVHSFEASSDLGPAAGRSQVKFGDQKE